MPTVTVRYFAALREQRGRDQESLQIPEGTTARSLYRELFPPGKHGALPVAFALDHEYVDGDTVLEDGDEVAFLPPLGGG